MKFEELTLKVIHAGLRRYSARAIMHRIRWFHHVEQRDGDFKCNNNHTPSLARWFMAKHPEYEGFFETREQDRGEQEQDTLQMGSRVLS